MNNQNEHSKSITVKKMIEDLKLEELNFPQNEFQQITTTELNRPGVQLAGFFRYFAYERIQLIGKVEHHYLNTLSSELRQRRIDELLSYEIPCLIISRDLEVHEEILLAAEKYQRKILRSSNNTTKLMNILVNYLEYKLAPTVTLHGVLMDVYGVGVLITGKSGIGKSETAVELIKRGHLLVADDSVEINRIGLDLLIGRAPELIGHMIEVRGIGLMDIKSLFGVGAIKEQTDINMVIHLEEWDAEKVYDRLGLEDHYQEILEVKINEVVIPIKPARNISLLIEIAARNFRLKEMGYNAAQEFDKRLKEQLSRY